MTFAAPVGYALTVNNDYHQMMLDLRRRARNHPFVTAWRASYDYPYRNGASSSGPILAVGAGTGNDVSAALRNTDRKVYAVEIDPTIARLSRTSIPSARAQDPRVELVIDDARSFFQDTDQALRAGRVRLPDSHALLSCVLVAPPRQLRSTRASRSNR